MPTVAKKTQTRFVRTSLMCV